MSKKDPAFLFYSKDWLEGTAEMTSEEKGVYIDLLAHQHQKGGLPVEMKRLCKLVGLGEIEFMKIWPDIQHKFKVNSDNRLVNRRLTEVVTERLEKGHKNKIISALAVAVRQSNLPYEVKFEAKKGFNVLDFFDIPEPNITEKVTEWFNLRLKSIANANANEDANGIYNNTKGNVDFKFWEQEKQNFLQAGDWIFKFCRDKNIKLEFFDEQAKEFISDLELKEEYKEVKELKRHFTNWYNKKEKANRFNIPAPKNGKINMNQIV